MVLWMVVFVIQELILPMISFLEDVTVKLMWRADDVMHVKTAFGTSQNVMLKDVNVSINPYLFVILVLKMTKLNTYAKLNFYLYVTKCLQRVHVISLELMEIKAVIRKLVNVLVRGMSSVVIVTNAYLNTGVWVIHPRAANHVTVIEEELMIISVILLRDNASEFSPPLFSHHYFSVFPFCIFLVHHNSNRCRPNITGRTCNTVEQTYFLPSFDYSITEAEGARCQGVCD